LLPSAWTIISQRNVLVWSLLASPMIAVCVLAKNESSRLPRLFESLGGGEFVIVGDTGSTDETREIAKAAGAVVIDIPWEEHFANARNALHATVKSEWLCWADADFVFAPSFLRDAKRACERTPREVDTLMVTLVVKRGNGALRVPTPRIIRASIPMRGRVHETPQGICGRMTSLEIEEQRTNESPNERRAKDQKYEVALRREIDECPSDLHAYPYLLRMALKRNDWRDARKILDRKPVWTHFDLWVMARLLMSVGRHREAVSAVETGIRLEPSDPCLWTTLGDLYTEYGDIVKALANYETACSLSQRDTVENGIFYYSEEEITVQPRMNKAALLVEIGEIAEARNALEESLRLCPSTYQRTLIESNLEKLKRAAA
jgi:glycosyltransferase involved in cell wall biosynthesis